MTRRETAQIWALAVLAAYFMVWPVWRAQFPVEIWFTESWNAFHQDAAAAGFPLYPSADELVVNNYPPLSFMAIGALGKLFGDNLFVGRAVSLIGLFAISIEIAIIVRLIAGSVTAGIVGALWYVSFMAHNATSYVGANDPQIAGLAIMGAALVWFVVCDKAGRALEPALLLMVVAGFWKHNNIGIPLTAISWIVARDWRAAARPVAVSAGAAVAGLLICAAIFGPAFLDNLLTPRTYTLGHLLSQAGHLQWVALGALIWAAWAVSDRTSYAARFTGLLIGWGLFSCLLQWLGDGIFGNAEFDLILAVAIGLGATMAGIRTTWLAARVGAGPARDVVVALLIVRLLASDRQESGSVLFSPQFRASVYDAEQTQIDAAVQVALIAGPVLCRKDNLLCRRAGKAFVVDDFKTDQMTASGLFSEEDIGQLIKSRGITVFVSAPKALGESFAPDLKSAR